MTGRVATLVAMVAAVAVVTFTMAAKPLPRFVWNSSESAPIGLYGVQSVRTLSVTSLVVALPPEPLATFLADGGYLPRGVPLIKRILALPGQIVCRNGLLISVDRIDIGAARERDARGRPLPAWHGCRVLSWGEVFLMNWDEPASMDGRYFGPIPSSAIVGHAEPLWTFDSAPAE
jgi:conjugative transfer signal peptidase TraF